jgi:hypothetical protein
LRDLAEKYPEACNAEKWTYELFMQAHTLTITRCFGVQPHLMLVPFADCANHHTVDNHFNLSNTRLSGSAVKGQLNGVEKNYLTTERKKINFLKHFSEDKIDENL